MVAANLRNNISMQPMRTEGGCHVVKGPPFYSCGCRVGFFFSKLCLNFGVESGLCLLCYHKLFQLQIDVLRKKTKLVIILDGTQGPYLGTPF
jgi:hypothetical protein